MTDIARIIKPEQAGFAADNRPECPRQYPPGWELAHQGNAHLAHDHKGW